MNKFYFIILALMLVIPSIYATITLKEPTSWDWRVQHSSWIDNFLMGKKDVFKNYFGDAGFYPFLFHVIMTIPYLLLGSNIKFLQILFAILSSGSVLYLVYKLEGRMATLISGFVLSSSYVYLMFSSTLTPQVFDFILFPIAYLLLSNKKYLYSSVVILAIMHLHLFGIVFYGIFFIYSLLVDKKFIKYLLIILILSIPVIIFYYYPVINYMLHLNKDFMASYTNNYSKALQVWITPKEIFYCYPIEHLIIFSGVAFLLLPFCVLKMRGKKAYNKQQLFYCICCLCFLPFMFFSYWRFLSYFILMLAIFEGSLLSDENDAV